MKLLKFYGGGVKKHFLKVVAAATVAVALFVGCTNNALDANIKTPSTPTPTPTPIVSPAAVLDTTLPTPKTIKVIATTTENNGEKVIYGQELTLHGQIRKENGEPASRYERLPQTLLDKKGASADNTIANGDLAKIVSQGLNKESAGLYFSFETDTTSLKLSGEFTKAPTVATSSSNQRFINGHFDLYELKNNTWTYVGTAGTTVNQTSFTDLAVSNFNNTSKEKRKYLLLFPLYNGVAYQAGSEDNVAPTKDLKLTVDKGCYFADTEFMGESTRLPILIYGTSITQGASPEHVGEAYTSQVMLQLKREVINMGFSGSAYTHEEMGNFIAKIKSEICFMDPTMNHSVSTIAGIRGIDTFAKKYRDANPNTPIVLVSQFDNQNNAKGNAFSEMTDGDTMKACYDKMLSTNNDKNVAFISRLDAVGHSFIPTCKNDSSGIHPDTAGMAIWAQKYIDCVTKASLAPQENPLTNGLLISTLLDVSKMRVDVDADAPFTATLEAAKKRILISPKAGTPITAANKNKKIYLKNQSGTETYCTYEPADLFRYYEVGTNKYKFELKGMFHFDETANPAANGVISQHSTQHNSYFDWNSGDDHYVKVSASSSVDTGVTIWTNKFTTDFDYVEFRFKSDANKSPKFGYYTNGKYFGYTSGKFFVKDSRAAYVENDAYVETKCNDATSDWVTFGLWNNSAGKGAIFVEDFAVKENLDYDGREVLSASNSNQWVALNSLDTTDPVYFDYIAFYKKVN